ncbi:hypothetical protein INT48_004807 [Thamnidium elegans]|uniref:Uncharacterized protein n=1 Tax=Thamnidium elegans TaxID=101142 RepID=A0A8H7VUM0_9FUNG|nr:hypothetical protein INT48_004807 [Thamnidium elegans]
MKTTSLFFAIASVASVFAAAVPGVTDMSSTAISNNGRQANTAFEQSPANNHRVATADVIQGTSPANSRVATSDVIQGTSPVSKQDTSPTQDEYVSSDFTPFFVESPEEGDIYVTGQVAKIEWINGVDGPFLIRVLTGKIAKSMQPTNVTLRGDGPKGYYDWTVPGYLHDGTYALQFSYKIQGKP